MASTEKRGRKPLAAAPIATVELNPQAIAELQTNSELVQQTIASYSGERDLANQLLGQAQAFEAMSQFSRIVRTQKLAYVKKSGAYKALKGKKTPHGAELEGTWDEYCSLLGMSADTADRDIGSLETFGPIALENMTQAGLSLGEIRRLQRLPEDAREALTQIAESGDKDSLLDLAEDLIARQRAEKDRLEAELKEARTELNDKIELNAKLSEAAAQAEEKAIKAQRKWRSAKPDEQMAVLQACVTTAELEITSLLGGAKTGLQSALMALAEHCVAHQLDSRAFMGDVLGRLLQAVRVVRDGPDYGFSVPVVNDGAAR